ncbi:DUF2062 domain-containing protein [Limisalsivibrio acetivorans]|uniref:DUF2062 domain-containing protein n=1 Tax=Limisalsivibrio acetivorans TaxID=1304888 RepID=UPI0003B5D3A8|nr:DUF2062 domain-containing protein [Limisalsivibrio acetivorans]
MFIEALRAKIRRLIQLDCSPSRIAAASAVGIFIGFSPYLGLHTALAIGASFVFSLPLYPLLLGAYITNPLTMVFIYAACYKFGKLFVDGADLNIDIGNLSLTDLFTTAKAFLPPFMVGTHLLGFLVGIFTYLLIYYIVKKYREAY